MSDYIEYYTIVYRNNQRMIVLNDSAKPTPRPPSKPKRGEYYIPIQKKNAHPHSRLMRSE
jgi:hypothetical protein